MFKLFYLTIYLSSIPRVQILSVDMMFVSPGNLVIYQANQLKTYMYAQDSFTVIV